VADAFARVASAVRRHGPLPFDRYIDLVLYDNEVGFYASGGSAGRRGDFITSPEVGPLFGAVVAQALDVWWDDLGRPDPFVVVEAGAGRGVLAKSVIVAQPRCSAALRYVLVERSAALRRAQADLLALAPPSEALSHLVDGDQDDDQDDDGGDSTEPHRRHRGLGPVVTSLGELPSVNFTGVIIANELLDNLAWCIVQYDGSNWQEVRVGVDPDDSHLVEVLVPAPDGLADVARSAMPSPPVGCRLPLHVDARRWVTDALALLDRGRLVAIDYGGTTTELATRGGWLRCYQGHDRTDSPLAHPGEFDITIDVPFDQLWPEPTALTKQSEWLRRYGLDDLVAEGKRLWTENAGSPTVAALVARSRISEAEALAAPEGLGDFVVAEWVR
jgi:SAM-dependent MidA family methyltransferase